MSVCGECGTTVTRADRRYAGPCADCGQMTCPQHTFFYVDESNRAITDAARPKCEKHRGTA